MTLARRAKGYMTRGGFAMLVYRNGAWLWWYEPLPKHGGSES
jgi:hypothetical protein